MLLSKITIRVNVIMIFNGTIHPKWPVYFPPDASPLSLFEIIKQGRNSVDCSLKYKACVSPESGTCPPVGFSCELDSLSIAAYFKEHNEVILKTGSILFGKFEEKCSVC